MLLRPIEAIVLRKYTTMHQFIFVYIFQVNAKLLFKCKPLLCTPIFVQPPSNAREHNRYKTNANGNSNNYVRTYRRNWIRWKKYSQFYSNYNVLISIYFICSCMFQFCWKSFFNSLCLRISQFFHYSFAAAFDSKYSRLCNKSLNINRTICSYHVVKKMIRPKTMTAFVFCDDQWVQKTMDNCPLLYPGQWQFA